MEDPLLDDVKALMDKEKGDMHILKQILRACQNNEVISNYERNYVKKLAEKHLAKIPPSEEKAMEKLDNTGGMISEGFSSQKLEPLQTTTTSSGPKPNNTKKFVIIGIVLVGIILAGALAAGNFNSSDIDPQTDLLVSGPLSVRTDLSTYQKGDIISINGRSNTLGKISISIENQQGQLIWSEQINPKGNGAFSTLTIAGGVGWEKSGTYTVKVKNESETELTIFSFMT